ncbi:hypothetical protein ACFT4A_26680 [Streptomyces sp. NPDC057099]|uniref:hypothetical protein n=1 Tax=Streptomyces sp. NPDC057099 TaxID=3346019 RepID=UPI003630E5C1
MTAAPLAARAVLIGGVVCAAAACGTGTPASTQAPSHAPWQEPSAYTSTLKSSEGESAAEAEYAADGRPVRISLDREKNAIDDEARYVISAYERTDA